eukprot:gene7096-199_t
MAGRRGWEAQPRSRSRRSKLLLLSLALSEIIPHQSGGRNQQQRSLFTTGKTVLLREDIQTKIKNGHKTEGMDGDKNCKGEVEAKPSEASGLGHANDGAKQEMTASKEDGFMALLSSENELLPSARGSLRRKESGLESRAFSGAVGGTSTSSERNVEFGGVSMFGRASVSADLYLPESQGADLFGRRSLPQWSMPQRSLPPKTASLLAVLAKNHYSYDSNNGSLKLRRKGIPTRESFSGTMGGNLQAQSTTSNAAPSTYQALNATRTKSRSSSNMEHLSSAENQASYARASVPNDSSPQGTSPKGSSPLGSSPKSMSMSRQLSGKMPSRPAPPRYLPSPQLAPLTPPHSGVLDVTLLKQALGFHASLSKAESFPNLRPQATICELITEDSREGAWEESPSPSNRKESASSTVTDNRKFNSA